MNDSILNSVKKMLGIVDEYTVFDADIIFHINTVFMILNQLGVGPVFSISDAEALWSDYLSGKDNYESVKTYMYLKVKSMFDISQSSAVNTAISETIKELEWRLNFEHECEVS